MKICIMSDNHCSKIKTIQPVDIVIHCGDYGLSGTMNETADFLKQYSQLDAKYKLFVPGNHDRLIYSSPETAKRLFEYYKVELLIDSLFEADNIRLYGFPWSKQFLGWAFMFNDKSKEMEDKIKLIPENIDILISHGPPFNILDRNIQSINCGSESILDWVILNKPKYHIFGHIHEGVGCNYYSLPGTVFYNVSEIVEYIEI